MMASHTTAAAVEPPSFPPASLCHCRRVAGVEVFNISTSRSEVANDVLLVHPTLPAVIVSVGDSSSNDTFGSIQADGDDSGTDNASAAVREERAYWLRNTLREGKYGRIRYAVALQRRRGAADDQSSSSCEWEVTSIKCAVKEMSIDEIRRKRGQLAEDPIKEIAALQYMATCNGQDSDTFDAKKHCAIRHMKESHVVTPLDVLMSEEHIFTVMPYCDGELFDLLGCRDRFKESEARYWLSQILKGLRYLHNRADICHRDLRPENLLLHEESKSLMIIDFGVCLRLPPKVHNKRQLITPQGICGMLHFEAPEVAANTAFDGEKVDMFAAGVILFVMVTGFPPWERPHLSDERFKYMSGGYLSQMLTEWNLGLSPEVMDLLQGMLWLVPKDRLGIEQVQDHPWMKLSE